MPDFNNQLQRQFLEHLPVAVCCCGPDGVITEYNHQAAQLWGREPRPGEYFGEATRMFDVYGKRLEPDKTPIASVLRSGSAQRNSEVVIERPDGTRITVLSNAAPLCDGKGKLLGALEVFHDITERRWSEEARRVADRLAASARVASQVARQIKKPLHSMASLLDFLCQDANLSAEARSCTELIQQELLRFDRLAKEMVHLSMAA